MQSQENTLLSLNLVISFSVFLNVNDKYLLLDGLENNKWYIVQANLKQKTGRARTSTISRLLYDKLFNEELIIHFFTHNMLFLHIFESVLEQKHLLRRECYGDKYWC